MTDQSKRPTLRQAAQALLNACDGYGSMREQDILDAKAALRAALAEPDLKDWRPDAERMADTLCKLRAQHSILLTALEGIAADSTSVGSQMAAGEAIAEAEKEQ